MRRPRNRALAVSGQCGRSRPAAVCPGARRYRPLRWRLLSDGVSSPAHRGTSGDPRVEQFGAALGQHARRRGRVSTRPARLLRSAPRGLCRGRPFVLGRPAPAAGLVGQRGEGGPVSGLRASLGVVGRSGTLPRPGQQAPQELLAWLLRNGRREKLCNPVAGISGAPAGLVEDALQDVCLLAATTHKCRGHSEGEVYNWLKRTTLRRVRRLLDRAHLRREVLVDWDAAE